MEAYEGNPKVEKHLKDILLLLDVPTKPETDMDTCKGMMISRENPIRFHIDFIAKGNFLWNSGMFCFKAEFC
jgi:mannose-1-phosphate guanylyltransferase